MEKKAHYKMYKAGKNWIFAMLTTVALTGGMVMSGNTAKADTVAQGSVEQVTKVDTENSTVTSTQATTQVERVAMMHTKVVLLKPQYLLRQVKVI